MDQFRLTRAVFAGLASVTVVRSSASQWSPMPRYASTGRFSAAVRAATTSCARAALGCTLCRPLTPIAPMGMARTSRCRRSV
jgi:hypothetical protein